MVANRGVSAVGEGARAPVADSRDIVRVSAEYSGGDFGHETAVVVANDLPYHVVVLHLGLRFHYLGRTASIDGKMEREEEN